MEIAKKKEFNLEIFLKISHLLNWKCVGPILAISIFLSNKI